MNALKISSLSLYCTWEVDVNQSMARVPMRRLVSSFLRALSWFEFYRLQRNVSDPPETKNLILVFRSRVFEME